MAISKRDYFGNPVLQSITLADGGSFIDYLKSFATSCFDTESHRDMFFQAFINVWHNYGLGEDPYREWTGEFENDIAICTYVWAKSFIATLENVWAYYKPIVEAYETKISWSDGITTETTYNDVKNVDIASNQATSYALPNKTTSKPYGTPTSHNETESNNSNIKSGSVTQKGMLNPVQQRDLYIRLLRNVWVDMARDFDSLFCVMHA